MPVLPEVDGITVPAAFTDAFLTECRNEISAAAVADERKTWLLRTLSASLASEPSLKRMMLLMVGL